MEIEDRRTLVKTSIEDRRDRVEAALSIGLDLTKAIIAAGCSVEEAEIFRNDESLRDRVIYRHAIAIKDALELHQIVRKTAADKGNGAPLQWFLERMDPERWGAPGSMIGKPKLNDEIISVGKPDFLP